MQPDRPDRPDGPDDRPDRGERPDRRQLNRRAADDDPARRALQGTAGVTELAASRSERGPAGRGTPEPAAGQEPKATPGRQVRIAAVGDVHVEENRRGQLLEVLGAINAHADFLCLCGDLTYSGKPEQMRALVDELKGVEIPIIAVLGNHDHEGGVEEEMGRILKDVGVHVLDGEGIEINGIGFVGTKGFVGGFGKRSLAPFGERVLKLFVQTVIDEALRLENALRNIHTDTKVAVLHYAPICDTVVGEPEQIYPFLGCSRFLAPLEMHDASVIFHGHAHRGTMEGRTPAGIPVYNVALPLLRANGLNVRIWTCSAPERRGRPAEVAGGSQAGERREDAA